MSLALSTSVSLENEIVRYIKQLLQSQLQSFKNQFAMLSDQFIQLILMSSLSDIIRDGVIDCYRICYYCLLRNNIVILLMAMDDEEVRWNTIQSLLHPFFQYVS